MAGKLFRAGIACLWPGRHAARRVRDDLRRLEPVRRHRGLARRDLGHERRAQGQDAGSCDASSPQGGMGLRDKADDGGSGFRRQPDRSGDECEDRHRCGIGVSHAARARGGRRCLLLPGQDPGRLQAAVDAVSAPGRHGRGRRRAVRLSEPRLPVRTRRRKVPQRRGAAVEVVRGERKGWKADRFCARQEGQPTWQGRPFSRSPMRKAST